MLPSAIYDIKAFFRVSNILKQTEECYFQIKRLLIQIKHTLITKYGIRQVQDSSTWLIFMLCFFFHISLK